jgi:hypothetical protein
MDQGTYAVIDDLFMVGDALAEDYQGSYQPPCEAAHRLAEAAAVSPFAGVLVPVFDGLAEAWMLVGSSSGLGEC